MMVCAAPSYLQAHGQPRTVAELEHHQSINFRLASGKVFEWEFKVDGVTRKVRPLSNRSFNDADLVLQAVLNGEGLAQMAGYQVCDHLRAGRLVACLPQYAPDDRGHYVCYLNRRHLPTRIRVFIDYMTKHIRALDLHCLGTFNPEPAPGAARAA
jgi:DNA-binding transcriptional LysR family regulator